MRPTRRFSSVIPRTTVKSPGPSISTACSFQVDTSAGKNCRPAVLDPHKGMFVPYGSGCLLVRDAETLRRAHSIDADYMPTLQEDADLVDFCQISPELSRDYRGLRLWLPLKMHGFGPFREALDEKLDLAEWACDRLREIPEVEIVAEPQLSVVAFRLRRAGIGAAETDRLNHQLLERINARRRVYLTGTTLNGLFTLRICVLNFRTHRDRMEACLEDVRAALSEVQSAWPRDE